MVRRLKSDLVDAEGKKIYPERRLEALEVSYSADERSARALLDNYIAERTGNDAGGHAGTFVYQLLRKRLASSPAAFAATLEKHIETIEGRRRAERKSNKLDERILRRVIDRTREDYDDDDLRETAESEHLKK